MDWSCSTGSRPSKTPDRKPEVDGEGGLRDLAVAYSVIESSVAGRQVKVDEVASGSVNEYQREIDEALGI